MALFGVYFVVYKFYTGIAAPKGRRRTPRSAKYLISNRGGGKPPLSTPPHHQASNISEQTEQMQCCCWIVYMILLDIFNEIPLITVPKDPFALLLGT